jgi:hypothetical protein
MRIRRRRLRGAGRRYQKDARTLRVPPVRLVFLRVLVGEGRVQQEVKPNLQ